MDEIKNFDKSKLQHTETTVQEVPLTEWLKIDKDLFWHDIWTFCKQGNIAQLKAYLDSKKLDLHSPEALLTQPLCVALEAKRDEVARLLVEYGAPLNVRNRYGRHPISYATSCDASTVQLLLDKGADVNATSSADNSTALDSISKPDVVRLLIARGIKVNHQNVQNATALHFAAILNFLEVARILVEEGGADVSLKDKSGETAYDIALRLGKLELAEYLRSKAT